MSSNAAKRPADAGPRVIQQLSEIPAYQRPIIDVADLKHVEHHLSTTLIQRMANAGQGYLAWLAFRAAAMISREPAVDRDAEASWRSR